MNLPTSKWRRIKFHYRTIRNTMLRSIEHHLGLPKRWNDLLQLRCAHCGFIVDYRGNPWEQADRALDHSATHYPHCAHCGTALAESPK